MREEYVNLEELEIANSGTQYLRLSRPFKYLENSFSFNVDVCSRGFAFRGELFFDNILSNILELEEMDKTLKGSTTLKEFYMESFIKFEMMELGHLNIEIFISDLESDNHLKLSFASDQTQLKKIISFLRSSIRN